MTVQRDVRVDIASAEMNDDGGVDLIVYPAGVSTVIPLHVGEAWDIAEELGEAADDAARATDRPDGEMR